MSKVAIRYTSNNKVVNVTPQIAKILVKARRATYENKGFPESVQTQKVVGKVNKPAQSEVTKTSEPKNSEVGKFSGDIDAGDGTFKKPEEKTKEEVNEKKSAPWPSTVEKIASTVPLKKTASSKKANSKSEEEND